MARTFLGAHLGIEIPIRPPSSQDIEILIAVIASALLVGMIPAFRAYRNTLSDGLQLRMTMKRRTLSLLVLGAFVGLASAATAPVRQLDWETLLPATEREHYNQVHVGQTAS